MSDLTDFLLARLDEDTAIATGAGVRSGGATWRITELYDDVSLTVDRVDTVHGEPVTMPDVQSDDGHVAMHIARHDPARAVRQAEALRWAIDWLVGMDDSEVVLRKLALVWHDHPRFREEWRV